MLSEQEYVEHAERLWMQFSKETPEDLDKIRYPSTYYLKNKICVVLTLRSGSTGYSPVYCFSTEDGRLVEKFDGSE